VATEKNPVEILNRRNAGVEKIRGFADLAEVAKDRRIAEVNEQPPEAQGAPLCSPPGIAG
jgi:hypothetical protein